MMIENTYTSQGRKILVYFVRNFRPEF